MSKSQKKKRTPGWAVCVLSGLGALALYVGLTLLTALAVVRGAVAEGLAPAVLAGAAGLSVFLWSLLAVRRSALAPMTGALLAAGTMAAVLAGAGLACWGTAGLLRGGGWPILAAAAAGGAAAGLLGSRPRRKGRKKRA